MNMKQELKVEKPLWLKMSLEELEKIIEQLAKEEHTTEKIGLILRDQYGVPTTRMFGKKLGQILREKGLYKDADILNSGKKLERIKNHLQQHTRDKNGKRTLEIRVARMRKHQLYSARKKEGN